MELIKTLTQTGFNIERLKEDGKIDNEAHLVLKNRNDLALNLYNVSRSKLLKAFKLYYHEEYGEQLVSGSLDAFIKHTS